MPGEPTFRQKHEWARAHQSKPQAVSRDDADNGDDGIRWKQLLKGGATAAGGGANVILGAGATRVGFGRYGVPMIFTGGSDAVQGLTMMWDAIKGRESEGWNPGKEVGRYAAGLLDVNPQWGVFGYDLVNLGSAVRGMGVKQPLQVAPDVINRTKSIFGKQVSRWDNSRSLPGVMLDSSINRPILVGTSLMTKAYHAYEDYPRHRSHAEE